MKTDLIYDEFKDYEVDIEYLKEFNNMYLQLGQEAFAHRFRFDNHYGASVVKHFGSYGFELDLFELAVLLFDDNGTSELCYTTPITNDVICYLTNDDVLKILTDIKNLK